MNFLFGQAKLAIWKTRKSRRSVVGSLDAKAVLLGLVTARLRIEFSYCKLVGKMGEFVDVWGG